LNRDQIYSPSNFTQTRSKQLAEKLSNKLNEALPKNKTQGDMLREVFNTIKDFFLNLGRPTFKKRHVYDNSPPCSADINDSFIEIYNDTRLMSDEQKLLGNAFKQSFNFSTTERTRLRNRIKEVAEMVNDYLVTAVNTISRNFVIQDSFTNDNKLDMDNVGNPANVDTKAGLVSLKINGSINRSKDATVIQAGSTNWPMPLSIPGNFLVAKKKEPAGNAALINGFTSSSTKHEDQWSLEFSTDAHDDPANFLDGSPETWYEYQMINVKANLKLPGANPDTKGWGWTWDTGQSIYNGSQLKDKLDITILIKLAEKQRINWIDIHPYFPDKSCYITINDIQTSVNNAGDYVTCLDAGDRGTKIGADTGPALTVKDREKFKGHGTWVFADRECQFVRFDFTVEKPYDCPIGHIYWEEEYDQKTTKKFLGFKTSEKTRHIKNRIDGPKISSNGVIDYKNYSKEGALLGAAFGILGAALGFIAGLFFGKEVEIQNYKTRMGLDVYTDGNAWRWCLGLRGIDINTNTYEAKSTFMSKTFAVRQGLKNVGLSVSEFVPEEFFADNQVLRNKFIKYYISHDGGTTWNPISPVERTPVYGEKDFPAKVVSFVDYVPQEKGINKTYVQVEETPKTIKVMAELSRPEDMETMTPILYDYKLRIVTKEAAGE
jgi:hypothetical protein